MSWQGGVYRLAANSTTCLGRIALGLGMESCRIFSNFFIFFQFHFSDIYFKSQFLILHPNPLIFPDKLPRSGFTALLGAFLSHSALEKLHTYMRTTHAASSSAGAPPQPKRTGLAWIQPFGLTEGILTHGTFARLSSVVEGFDGRVGEREANESGSLRVAGLKIILKCLHSDLTIPVAGAPHPLVLLVNLLLAGLFCLLF